MSNEMPLEKEFDPLQRPIEPGKSCAGIQLGASFEEMCIAMGEHPLRRACPDALTQEYGWYEYVGVTFIFEPKLQPRLLQTRASWGYVGRAPQNLTVGMGYPEVEERVESLRYNPDEKVWYLSGIEGLFLHIAIVDFEERTPQHFCVRRREPCGPDHPNLDQAIVMEIGIFSEESSDEVPELRPNFWEA